MRILGHLLYISIFISIFLVGKVMVIWNRRWAYAISHNPGTAQDMSKFFLYGGRAFEVLGAVATGVDGIAVLVLCSHYLLDFASNLLDATGG
jgi:hypothetical protein